MAPDEWTDARIGDLARQYEALLRSYGELSKGLAVMERELASGSKATERRFRELRETADRDRQEGRDAIEKASKAFERTLEKFDEACDEKVARLEKMFESSRWPLMAKIGLFSAVFSPLMAALLLVIERSA